MLEHIMREFARLVKLNILYYLEPKIYPYFGGVSNVAYYLGKALAKKVNLTYFPRFMPKKSYVNNFFNVQKRFVTKEFDLVHFNVVPNWINGSFVLLKIAKMRGTPTVLNIHGLIQIEHKFSGYSSDSIPYMALLNTFCSCKDVDKIVVNSEYMHTRVATLYGIRRDKIVVIPNGIDLDLFDGCDHKLMLDGDPVILFIGLFSKIKGVDVLIKAIAKLRSKLPDMKLHLVGTGTPSDISDFQALAKRKGIEKFLVFHDWAPISMVPRYYKSADICVFPSRHEGFGISVLEAMASGVPLIASNIESFRKILSNGKNGILFKSGNADALSKGILALYQDLSLRKKISQAALETVGKYSWENIAERYLSLYKCLCD